MISQFTSANFYECAGSYLYKDACNGNKMHVYVIEKCFYIFFKP